jgi:cellulose synthase/poly-beta-1,6-N-acetylglucosamine synthase-like glycosyltransferase
MIALLIQICIGLLSVYISIQILIVLSLLFSPKYQRKIISEKPLVSILIAARNEALNILDCLMAIDKLKYPKDKLQVLIGNDQSEDETAQLVSNFIADKPYMQLYQIEKTVGKAKGKANVLAQLANHATGDFLFFTDADIEVNEYWVDALLSHQIGEHAAIVSGITVVKDKDLFSSMQRIDWLYFMGILYALHRVGFEATAVGNNMLVTQKAYEETGGYEHIDFSITEDYKLYQEIKKRNHNAINILSNDSINVSKSIATLSDLLHQRKRWLTGAIALPVYWWLVFGIFGMFLPACVFLFLFDWVIALELLTAKFILQWFIVFIVSIKAKIKVNYWHSILYEFYAHGIALLTSINFFLPTDIRWKNRTYTS